jgi:hypothetical protein
MSDHGRVDRRTVLKSLGASAVGPLVGDVAGLWTIGERHPLVPEQAGGIWAPTFFSRAENDAIVALSERIIPATDTPGGAAAHVNQYIDWIVGDAAEVEQRRFRDGLAWLEATSRERFTRSFAELGAAQQDGLLMPVAAAADAGRDGEPGVAFFRALKQRTLEGYYRSEVGMKVELGYAGNAFLNEFEGCTHPEHLGWTPPSGGAGA